AKQISDPGLYPAVSIAFRIVSIASSVPSNVGAKPPSSPTAVDRLRSCKIFFRLWKTSVPQRRASENEGAPTGITINSWKAIGASECEPPLTIFIIGIGTCLRLHHRCNDTKVGVTLVQLL